jgi:hypothetical protein
VSKPQLAHPGLHHLGREGVQDRSAQQGESRALKL